MIALDANILVYAHRRDSEWHDRAEGLVRALAEGDKAWSIPWPCIHEFVAIVTHPKVHKPASSLAEAITQVEYWMESPTLVLLSEGEGYWPTFKEAAVTGRIVGGAVPDARVAALCRLHGVAELWSADRDFGRFADIKVKNPLI